MPSAPPPAEAVLSGAVVIWRDNRDGGRDGVRRGTRDALTGVLDSAAGVLASISSNCRLSVPTSVGVVASVKRSR